MDQAWQAVAVLAGFGALALGLKGLAALWPRAEAEGPVPSRDQVPPYRPPESMMDPALAARFQIVASGLRLPVQFHYQPPSGLAETRRVTVQVVRMRPSRETVPFLYLDGYCHTRRAPRMFRTDRIAELTDLRTGEIISGPVALMEWIGEAALKVPRDHR